MEAPILRWSQRSFKNHSLVSENGGVRDAQRYSGVLVYRLFETIFFALFHTARTLSGSLHSPPSPRGEGFVSGIPLSPSNLRPFGAPPSRGRRELSTRAPSLGRGCRAQRGGVGFLFCGQAASSLPSLSGKALCQEKRYPRFAAFPIGEGFVSGIAASPSNLRPFGAPPSTGRRECPHEPLPLEGAAERSEAGLASAAG